MEAKVSKEDCIKLLRKRVQELKEKAAKDHTETEIKQKITDVFNGKKPQETIELVTQMVALQNIILNLICEFVITVIFTGFGILKRLLGLLLKRQLELGQKGSSFKTWETKTLLLQKLKKGGTKLEKLNWVSH